MQSTTAPFWIKLTSEAFFFSTESFCFVQVIDLDLDLGQIFTDLHHLAQIATTFEVGVANLLRQTPDHHHCHRRRPALKVQHWVEKPKQRRFCSQLPYFAAST